MKKKLILAVIMVLLAAGAASANTLSFKVNYALPKMNNDFWQIEFENMSFTKSMFQDTSFSFAYEAFLTPRISFMIGVESYSKTKSGFYKDFVGFSFAEGDFAFPVEYQGDFQPRHQIAFSVTPIQASIKIAPLGRRGKFVPYLGAGGGMYLYTLRMLGDMIDFTDEYVYDDSYYGEIPVYPIVQVDARQGENLGKVAFGWHVFGGIMIPVANRLTVDAEVKYASAKAKMTEGFLGFQPLDIGGVNISVGLSYWF